MSGNFRKIEQNSNFRKMFTPNPDVFDFKVRYLPSKGIQ